MEATRAIKRSCMPSYMLGRVCVPNSSQEGGHGHGELREWALAKMGQSAPPRRGTSRT